VRSFAPGSGAVALGRDERMRTSDARFAHCSAPDFYLSNASNLTGLQYLDRWPEVVSPQRFISWCRHRRPFEKVEMPPSKPPGRGLFSRYALSVLAGHETQGKLHSEPGNPRERSATNRRGRNATCEFPKEILRASGLNTYRLSRP